MKKLKLAIIGQGRSGRDIHGAFFKSKENIYFDVAAVVEEDEFRRNNAKQEYPGCKVFADYRELLELKDIDLVVNASYSDMHYEITKDLLKHHFNVLVEMPFARNYYECSDLIKTADERGVMLSVFQQVFFTPFYTVAKEIADSGVLGEILQVSVYYNGFARRWDWQSLQMRLGGSVYNTGPHPIGIAMGFLDFNNATRVEFSRLGRALTSGDAEDYAKIILTAPDKPVVDIEVSSTDAFSDFKIKIQGTKGTYIGTTGKYKIKYIVEGENPERPVIFETLKDEKGFPMYCKEDLITHTEEKEIQGTAFDVGVVNNYRLLYDNLTKGTPLPISNENYAEIVRIIETVHAQNPLSVKYPVN